MAWDGKDLKVLKKTCPEQNEFIIEDYLTQIYSYNYNYVIKTKNVLKKPVSVC
jgi:hypothetical protein